MSISLYSIIFYAAINVKFELQELPLVKFLWVSFSAGHCKTKQFLKTQSWTFCILAQHWTQNNIAIICSAYKLKVWDKRTYSTSFFLKSVVKTNNNKSSFLN